MAPPKNKRPKRSNSPDPDDDDDEERLPYFVPEAGIDIEALALYARGILDREARIRTGTHPQRPEQKGFWIMSSIAVTREDIAAMIEDTRSWRKEEKKEYYLNSETAKRRLKVGRAPAAKERPMSQARSKRETEDGRSMPQAVSRASADNLLLGERNRPMRAASPAPRPSTGQPAFLENRRPSAPVSYPSGYNVTATTQYSLSINAPQMQSQAQAQYTFDQEMAPPPYTEVKRGGGSGHPSTTGTQGFQSLYATAGGPPPPLPPPSGPPPQQRRHHHGSG